MGLRNIFFNVPWIFIKSRALLQGNFKTEKKIIQDHVSKNSFVLDFGCGTGQYSELFDNGKYVGVDVPGPHLSYAKRHFPGKSFVKFDKNFNVPLKSSIFDWILCFAVVHHVPDLGINIFQHEILRLLKPDGKLLVVDPVIKQKSFWSKFLLSIDRGRFPRTPLDVVKMFGNAVNVKERTLMKVGSYMMYVLVLEKKDGYSI